MLNSFSRLRQRVAMLRQAELGIPIGKLSATLPGYPMYEVIEVFYDPDTGTVTCTLAEGGSDWGGHYSRVTTKLESPASARKVMDNLRYLIRKSSLVKAYGKPTKNFTWTALNAKGLSVGLCDQALKRAMKSYPQ